MIRYTAVQAYFFKSRTAGESLQSVLRVGSSEVLYAKVGFMHRLMQKGYAMQDAECR